MVKSSKTTKQNLTKIREPVSDRIGVFPQRALDDLTRGLELAFAEGMREKAHWLVDDFFNRLVKNKKTLEVGDPVSALVSVQTANILEEHGYMTISAVLFAKREELRALPSLGEGRFDEIIRSLIANGFVKPTSLYTK